MSKLGSILGRAALVILLTLLLLEVVTRLMWGQQSTIEFGDKELTLLPRPIITPAQRERLRTWANTQTSFLMFDPVLGWTNRPNATVEKEGITLTSNSIGLRTTREYTPSKPRGVTRLAAFGPSFTFGDEVPDQASWPAMMEQLRPELEVMNWGVNGYGTDQSMLRYRMYGAAYRPDIVFIGYEDNNQFRNVNRFRPFYKGEDTDLPLTKPIFVPNNNQLELIDNPYQDVDALFSALDNRANGFIDTVCPRDAFCDPALYRSYPLDLFASARFLRTLIYEISAFDLDLPNQSANDPELVTLALLETFVSEVLNNQSQPVVVFFPQQVSTLRKYESGQLRHYHDYIPELEALGAQVIDLNKPLVQTRQARGFDYADFFVRGNDGGHYTKLANQIVAETIIQHLCDSGTIQRCNR